MHVKIRHGCNVLQVPIHILRLGGTKEGEPSPPGRIKIVMACVSIILRDESLTVGNSPLAQLFSDVKFCGLFLCFVKYPPFHKFSHIFKVDAMVSITFLCKSKIIKQQNEVSSSFFLINIIIIIISSSSSSSFIIVWMCEFWQLYNYFFYILTVKHNFKCNVLFKIYFITQCAM